MASSHLPWLLLIISFTVFSGMVDVYSQCLQNQKTILLQFKHSLIFDASLSSKLVLWNSSMDCCSWAGVTCSSGHVTALDLNDESITDGVNSSSSLFHLQYLQSLNLAYNDFNDSEISPEFGKLANLTYLNMSMARFSGQIPIEISRLTKLVTLDISSNDYYSLQLENPNLRTLIRNLSSLEELYLGGVDISANGYEWCRALSSSLPNLRVLSLSYCNLLGPIDSSLAKLRHLSVINLGGNNFSAAPIPEFFANFTNLTNLGLSYSELNGTFPEKVFQIPTLQAIDLSFNPLLKGSLPEFLPRNGSLHTLALSYTNFSGKLPDSIGNLKRLSRIYLASCNFNGTIPSSLFSLPSLQKIFLNNNQFDGTLDYSMVNLTQLVHLDLLNNRLTGQIPSHQWEGLLNLVKLDLSYNSLSGSIPLSLFSSHLRGLEVLLLSYNNFNGTLDFSSLIQNLPNLTYLDLSFNNLSIITTGNESSSTPFHQFSSLNLASCKLSAFPNLKNQSNLYTLDLSSNQLRGEIPSWIWNNRFIYYLNLSNNMLVDFEKPLPQSLPYLNYLDLHSNHLQGQIPILTSSPSYLDYSHNNFSSIIPDDIGNNITSTYFFSLSNNFVTGTIPKSICNASNLEVLDLSYNSLNGTIPSCLVQMSEYLGVLNLRSNHLSGTIPDTFPAACNLQTLDFNGNLVEGLVPRTLDNCAALEVLNLGNNRIADNFPCWLNNSPNLRVLILRANKFRGSIECAGRKSNLQKLQIVDVAFNNFSGNLPSRWFYSWKAMMADVDVSQRKADHLHYELQRIGPMYYQDAVTIMIKGLQLELVKILTVYTSIDFSSNNFEGGIPEVIGELKSLYALNMSLNAFTGQIPTSLGNLSHLESLDLSQNKLTGSIPNGLASITFLSFLNLSFNQLAGTIPRGNQFETFANTSYLGNSRLCGSPLSKTCPTAEGKTPTATTKDAHSNSDTTINWDYISVEMGFLFGLGIVIGPLIFWKRWRNWYNLHVDLLLSKIFRLQYQGRNNYRRRPHRNHSEKDSDEDEQESDAEDLAKADEDESDLDLAWKMLDVARAIVEKHSGDTMEKVDILSVLAEVALEREDIETSLSDYLKALSILERLVEPDSRFICELNFRICFCLEVGSKAQEAIPYCQKAISICKSRVERLKREVKDLLEARAALPATELDQVDNQFSIASLSDDVVPDMEVEIETLIGLCGDLEKKLEDLQQLVSNPTSILSEILGIMSKARGNEEKGASSAALRSSQMATANSSGDLESPTVSTAHTNGAAGVTHLGVVGRGVKRVLMNSGMSESGSNKKPALDPPSDNGAGSAS